MSNTEKRPREGEPQGNWNTKSREREGAKEQEERMPPEKKDAEETNQEAKRKIDEKGVSRSTGAPDAQPRGNNPAENARRTPPDTDR